MKNGGGVLTPHKETQMETNAGLKSHLRGKSDSGSGVLTPHKEKAGNIGGAEAPLPKRHSHLPHIDLDGYYQFVTFRTFDSIDAFIRKWDFSPVISNKEKQLKIDEYLDISTSGAYLQNEALSYLYDFLISHDKKLYELTAFCIMNNHVHILFKPLESLSKVMQMIKGVSAKKINELLGVNGKFWADDYYDKVIRDERHFWVVYEYIKNNPLKIGGTKAALPSVGGVKTPLPKENGSDTLVSDNYSGAKATLPRFYGIFE